MTSVQPKADVVTEQTSDDTFFRDQFVALARKSLDIKATESRNSLDIPRHSIDSDLSLHSAGRNGVLRRRRGRSSSFSLGGDSASTRSSLSFGSSPSLYTVHLDGGEKLEFHSFPPFRMFYETLKEDATNSVVWIDLQFSPDESMEVIHDLQRLFQLHPLTMDDAITEDTLDKLETFGEEEFPYTFVLIREPQWNATAMETRSVGLVLAHPFCLSIHVGPVLCTTKVMASMATGDVKSNSEVFGTLILELTNTYAPLVEKIQGEAGVLSELVLLLSHGEQGDLLTRLTSARRDAKNLYRLVDPLKDVLRKLDRHEIPLLAEQDKSFVRNPLEHALRMKTELKIAEEIIYGAFKLYGVKVGIKGGMLNMAIDRLMKRFTSAAAIVLPLNLVTGLWGMNIPVPWQDKYEGFYGICGFMALYLVLMIVWFRARRWI